MVDGGPRTGTPRDVPPPRPVGGGRPADDASGDGGGPGRAVADAVADAVAALLDGGRRVVGAARGGGADPGADPGAARAGAAGARGAGALRDAVGAVSGAVSAVLRPRRPDGSGTRAPGALLGDLLAAAAPRLPVRSAERLRAAHPGLTDDEIADALVARAARLSSGIGATTGGVAAVRRFVPPSLLAVPLEIGAEVLLTAGVEVVLVGELHELYGRPAPGDARARAAAYLGAWSARRSIDRATGSGLVSVLGSAGLRAVRQRTGHRLARAVPLLGLGALAGRSNGRATEALAARVRADLRAARGTDPAG